ncbi:hypothetical protein [Clostridium butyricum]|uniref:hypothetical protein n=1 Tax=Clostridium butyricum TaxID=1492 RepID=UPI00374E8001
MNLQSRYWSDMTNLKFKLYYVDYFYENYSSWDNGINIFLAFLSCGSIAGWSIWNSIPFVWTFLIAISQVITAIRPHLSLSKYIKSLYTFSINANNIFLDYEDNWYKVANGELTNEEINSLISKLKRKLTKLTDANITPTHVPENNTKALKKAQENTEAYFRSFK